ncbi:MAG TPA: hypothetical protein VIN93_15485 [Bryobacteraceae bacterium]
MEKQTRQPKLDPLGLQILAHLKEYRPLMSAELEKQGNLLSTVRSLEELAKQSLADGISAGLDYQAAWEQARQVCFLPDEGDVPSLPHNPLYPTTAE